MLVFFIASWKISRLYNLIDVHSDIILIFDAPQCSNLTTSYFYKLMKLMSIKIESQVEQRHPWEVFSIPYAGLDGIE